MKLITMDTDYAVRALLAIARERTKVFTVSGLSRDLGIPGPFLRKILQTLRKKGVLRSHQGRGGGFKLVSDPGEIYLSGIIEIFQGPFGISKCVVNGKTCSYIKHCTLRNNVSIIEKMVVEKISAITLESLSKNDLKA